MALIVLIGIGVLLQGCGPSAQVKFSSENHVTVESYSLDAAKAQQLADAECAKYHRRAKIAHKASPHGTSTIDDERDYVFACVEEQ